MKRDNIVIVLGRYLNDDSSISYHLKERLDMAIELYNDMKPTKIIVSGGLANEKAGCTEAAKMKEYLLDYIPSKDIILEDKSITTTENAIYSISLLKEIETELNINTIIICSTEEHFTAYSYNVIKIFETEIKKQLSNGNIRLMIYTNTNEITED